MLASFVCDAYWANGIEIRRMFCKQMADSNMLPSTSGTLKQHILREHVQASIYDNMTLGPLQNGFCKDANAALVYALKLEFLYSLACEILSIQLLDGVHC